MLWFLIFFSYVQWTFVYFLCEIFLVFYYWLFWTLQYWVVSYVIHSGHKYFSLIYTLQIFSLIPLFKLSFLMLPFEKQKLLILIKSNVFLLIHMFVSYLGNLFIFQVSQDFSFSSIVHSVASTWNSVFPFWPVLNPIHPSKSNSCTIFLWSLPSSSCVCISVSFCKFLTYLSFPGLHSRYLCICPCC